MSTDVLDQAAELSEALARKSEAEIRAKVPQPIELDEDDVVECESCGNPVSTHRARLGYTICLECASWSEKRSKQYGKKFLREYD